MDKYGINQAAIRFNFCLGFKPGFWINGLIEISDLNIEPGFGIGLIRQSPQGFAPRDMGAFLDIDKAHTRKDQAVLRGDF